MLYLMLAEGFEDIEAIATLDIIRRADINIKTVGVTGKFVTSAHGVTVKADISKEEIDFEITDGIVLPGGIPGVLNLQRDEAVTNLVRYCVDNGRLVAAICAAPMILGEMGVLNSKNATCFPGYEESLDGANVKDESIILDGNFITARGAGVSLRFGAAIVDYFNEGTGNKVLARMQFEI